MLSVVDFPVEVDIPADIFSALSVEANLVSRKG